MTPTEFERLIARIHTTLEQGDALVTWDDSVSDPDSPNDLRQIDVTIRRGGSLTIVECRLHRRKQDVNWIEQLHGRRQSMRADSVIAVSSSGFTSLAKTKAAALGVILRTLHGLTPNEVLTWGQKVEVYLRYIGFRVAHFNLCDVPVENCTVASADTFRTATGEKWPLANVLTSAVTLITDSFPYGACGFAASVSDLWIRDIRVSEIIFSGAYYALESRYRLPAVYVYEQGNAEEGSRLATVQTTTASSYFEIHRNAAHVETIVDLASVPRIRNAVLQRVLVDYGEQPRHRRVFITGAGLPRFSHLRVSVSSMSRSNPLYAALRSTDATIQSEAHHHVLNSVASLIPDDVLLRG